MQGKGIKELAERIDARIAAVVKKEEELTGKANMRSQVSKSAKSSPNWRHSKPIA